MNAREFDVIIIGGGPAGLRAATVLAEDSERVGIFDRMPSLGRKFLIAGRGGLNLTHAEPVGNFPESLSRRTRALAIVAGGFRSGRDARLGGGPRG